MHMHKTYSTEDRAGFPVIEGYGQGSHEIRFINNKKITKSVSVSQLRISMNTFITT